MIIKYSPQQQWYKEIVEQPEKLFSKKNQKRIRSTLTKVDNYKIKTIVKKLDEGFLNWFTPKYIKMIDGKQNAAIHNIYESTLGNTNSESQYWCLVLFENNIPVGGTIFGVREEKLMVAFKVYPYNWETGTLQANPSLYTEYVLAKHGYDIQKKFMSHGRDRNPYGINAAIGLATFKLSTGYKPYILKDSSDYQETSIDTKKLKQDALILHFPKNNELITKATLVTSKKTVDRHIQVTKYPGLLDVSTEYLD